jgi:hypothetical protein
MISCTDCGKKFKNVDEVKNHECSWLKVLLYRKMYSVPMLWIILFAFTLSFRLPFFPAILVFSAGVIFAKLFDYLIKEV